MAKDKTKKSKFPSVAERRKTFFAEQKKFHAELKDEISEMKNTKRKTIEELFPEKETVAEKKPRSTKKQK